MLLPLAGTLTAADLAPSPAEMMLVGGGIALDNSTDAADQVAEKIGDGRTRRGSWPYLTLSIPLHLIVREAEGEAWDTARRLIRHLSDDTIATAQRKFATESDSVWQHRILALHGGSRERSEIASILWAGVGLVRGGAGTALVGDAVTVAERIHEYRALGIETVVASGYEEAYQKAELLFPLLDLSSTAEPARAAVGG